MSSESAVSGFQFVLSDYPNAINITGASGGISGVMALPQVAMNQVLY